MALNRSATGRSSSGRLGSEPSVFVVARVLGTLVAVVLISASSVVVQNGTIYGQVTDAQTGDSIARVAVYFFDLELGGLSQQNGRFLLRNVPAGTHTLTVARIGYETVQRRIAVADGQTVEYNIAISETPPE